MNVQVIDLKHPNWGEQFIKSLKNTGFAIVRNSKVETKLINEVYGTWKTFFELSEEEKRKHTFTPETQEGYFPFKSEKAKDAKVSDLKEFFHIFSVTKLEKYGFSPTEVNQTRTLMAQLATLGKRLLIALDTFMPPEVASRYSIPLANMIDSQNKTLFRILYYPPVSNHSDGAVRSAPHEDINLITLLPAATDAGLQVKDLQGKWHFVDTKEGDIVVNAGDMLQEATGKYIISTTHRVLNPTEYNARLPRMSMPLFVHPRPEIVLSEKYTAKTYLEERLRELGLL